MFWGLVSWGEWMEAWESRKSTAPGLNVDEGRRRRIEKLVRQLQGGKTGGFWERLRGGVYRMLKDVQHKCGPAWETNPLQWYSSAPNQDRHKFIRKSTRGGFQHLFGRQLPSLPRKVFISHNKVFFKWYQRYWAIFLSTDKSQLIWYASGMSSGLPKTPKIFMWLSTLVPYIRSNENLGSSSEGSGLAA